MVVDAMQLSVGVQTNFNKSFQSLAAEKWLGRRQHSTFEPCPMCCGAILASGVSTLVLGARFSDGSSQWGDYAVEKLLEMTGRRDRLRVVSGVLAGQCLDLQRLEAS